MISEVSLSSLQSIDMKSMSADPVSTNCHDNGCSFDSIMSSVSSSDTGNNSSILTTSDGTAISSWQGNNNDLGQTLVSSVLSVKADGLSRAESFQQKLNDLKSTGAEEVDPSDLNASFKRFSEFSMKMLDLQSSQANDKIMTMSQQTAVKKSAEGVQQLVKG